MRVALVMASHGEGGLEKHVVELATGMWRRGIEVCLIAHPMYESRLPDEVEFFPIDLTAHRRNPFALYRLFRLLRKVRPQIIHAHGSKAASMISPLLPFLSNTYSVATLHSRKKNVRMFSKFERVIAVSKIAAANLKHSGIRIIHNGVDPDTGVAAPAFDAWRSAAARPRVLAIGRLVPVKGFDLLIQSWKGVEAQLAIAGEGFERDHLARLIRETGQQDKITLLGQRNDVPALLSATDLFVISSRYEGGPYTLIEALQHRVPVVSTAVGAVVEILPKDFICPTGDPAALAERVKSALEDLEQTKRALEPVFRYARTELTFEHLLERTTSVYEELVSGE